MKNLYYKFNDYAYNETEKFININLTMAQSKKKGLKYLKKIKTNKINNIKNQINNKPKISVVIPLFNCQNTIDLTLKSIHFQNIKEIEIILINDCSLDNTSHIIKKFKNFDQRIKIINNLRNMGTFYSRCIGALKANGEYIIGIDNDDLFLSENIFETLYLNAKINFLDICEIKSFNIPNYNPKYKEIKIGYYLSHQDNIILHQPELGSFSLAINKNKVFTKDHFAWGKLIKASIYKKAINKLGKERYSKYNCFTEDVTIVFVLFNTADSFAYLNIFGIFHIVTNATTTFQLSKNQILLTKIYYLGILFDFSRNDFITKNFVAKYSLKSSFEKINNLDYNEQLIFFSIIKKIINCKFVSKKYKNKIKEKFYLNLYSKIY